MATRALQKATAKDIEEMQGNKAKHTVLAKHIRALKKVLKLADLQDLLN